MSICPQKPTHFIHGIQTKFLRLRMLRVEEPPTMWHASINIDIGLNVSVQSQRSLEHQRVVSQNFRTADMKVCPRQLPVSIVPQQWRLEPRPQVWLHSFPESEFCLEESISGLVTLINQLKLAWHSLWLNSEGGVHIQTSQWRKEDSVVHLVRQWCGRLHPCRCPSKNEPELEIDSQQD